MATTNYENEERRREIARARATKVPVIVRVAVTNPSANASAEFAEWASHNPHFRKWPCSNSKLFRKWRMVRAGYFRDLARLVSDGPAVSVLMGTSTSSLLPRDIEIPFGSRPTFSFQVVPA